MKIMDKKKRKVDLSDLRTLMNDHCTSGFLTLTLGNFDLSTWQTAIVTLNRQTVVKMVSQSLASPC